MRNMKQLNKGFDEITPISVRGDTHKQLRQLGIEKGLRSLDDVIQYLFCR